MILLRAEANCAASTSGTCTGDTTAAATDIDRIRVNSGGLAPSSGLNASNILDELLKQKRYSLLFEGGHRWIDARRYGRLASLPQDATTTSVTKRFTKFPLPQFECDPRTPKPFGCGTQAGF